MTYTNGGRACLPHATGVGRALAGTLLLVSICAGGAFGQDTTRAAPADSLAERLRRAEEAIDLLREQVATQAASAVSAASRVRVELFGRVMTNAFSNSGAVNNADVPLFVLPDGPGRGAGASIRQSSLGIAVTVERVLGGTFEGELHTDFFGGQQPSTGGRNFPLLRVRTARGIVRWARGELLVGQENPLMAGVSPQSVASFGTPEFTAAGNLWLWLPQIRGTVELGSPARLAIQGAMLAPASGDPAGAFDTDVDAAERARRPVLQARLRSRWGTEEAPGEIGVGAHRGWLRRPDGGLVASHAVAVDAVVPIGAALTLRGEWYAGQALRGLGGGGIGQGLTTAGDAVRDRGGWAQLDVRPDPRIQASGGCGVADPDDDDLPAGRQRNVGCAAQLVLRPDGPVVVALGYRRHRTTYAAGPVSNDHMNLAAGFEF